MGAAIEAPLALLQIPVETFFADSVEPAQVPLRLVPEILDAVDMVTTFGDERLTVVHASVPELRDVQRVICTEAVGIHDAIGPNPLADDGHQRFGFGIGDESSHHMTAPF